MQCYVLSFVGVGGVAVWAQPFMSETILVLEKPAKSSVQVCTNVKQCIIISISRRFYVTTYYYGWKLNIHSKNGKTDSCCLVTVRLTGVRIVVHADKRK